ncbi:MAG: tRNA 4-thiouridine(8) synthase ThiI [Desulfococcaceae bacterium]
MNRLSHPVRGLGLCSGGLDSILSALVLRDQGVEVAWISFETPFFTAEKARAAAEQTGVPLLVRDITPIYLKMLRHPKRGFGRNMNPCLDCHTLMFQLAGEEMKRSGFDFLFSGEVLGQRPMSQNRNFLRYVEKHSGFDGFVLRPLSALRLEPTVPESDGRVDRDRLLGITGRGRKDQIALAEAYGVTEYPAPAGGCLLTDRNYSLRLRDLLERDPDPPLARIHFLRYGRHFRLTDTARLVVGRDKADNIGLMGLYDRSRHIYLKTRGAPGPVALLPDANSDVVGADEVREAASICAGYSRAGKEETAEVTVFAPEGRERIRVAPMPTAASRRRML